MVEGTRLCGPSYDEGSLLFVPCNAKEAAGQWAQPRWGPRGLPWRLGKAHPSQADCCQPQKPALTAGFSAENGAEAK